MADIAVLKVDGSTHALVAHGAIALHMTHKDLVGAAVREYLADRRDTTNARLRAAMAQIDDTEASQVSALTGMSPERIAELGGVLRVADDRSTYIALDEIDHGLLRKASGQFVTSPVPQPHPRTAATIAAISQRRAHAHPGSADL